MHGAPVETKEPKKFLRLEDDTKNKTRRKKWLLPTCTSVRPTNDEKKEISNKSERERKWQQRRESEQKRETISLFRSVCLFVAPHAHYIWSFSLPVSVLESSHRFKCQQVKSNCVLIASYSEKTHKYSIIVIYFFPSRSSLGSAEPKMLTMRIDGQIVCTEPIKINRSQNDGSLSKIRRSHSKRSTFFFHSMHTHWNASRKMKPDKKKTWKIQLTN